MGLGYCAARRIPCACNSCVEKLKLAWDNARDKKDQPRYSRNQKCVKWEMFQGLNDWKIVETFAKNNNDRDSEKVKRTILRKRRSDMSGLIKMGETAAYAVEDKNANGFYLVKWTSEPYADQETKQLMCKGFWYNTYPNCTDIYFVMDTEVAVRVQYVLATRILMP